MVEIWYPLGPVHGVARFPANYVSKLDMEETANKIKDRRSTIEDQIRLSGMTLENAERVMRAYNRSLGSYGCREIGGDIY